MNDIALAGDWHGSRLCARESIKLCGLLEIRHIYQLGDFGLGWPGGWNGYIKEVQDACAKWDVRIWVTPGNHENYDWMQEHLVYDDGGIAPVAAHVSVLARGFRTALPGGRTLVSLGGAPSIDFPQRLEGRSWWRDEMITLVEAEKVAADGHADIMLAHDAPDGGTARVQQIIDTPWRDSGWTDRGLRYAREGRELMNTAVAGVQPKVFAHGHYHVADARAGQKTKYLSLACNGMHKNLMKLDLETLDTEWLA